MSEWLPSQQAPGGAQYADSTYEWYPVNVTGGSRPDGCDVDRMQAGYGVMVKRAFASVLMRGEWLLIDPAVKNVRPFSTADLLER